MPQDDLQDGDQRDGDHHADDAEKLSADEDSGNNRDGMYIDDAAHELRHEEMAVELLDDDVEDDDFRHDACPLKQSEENGRDRSDDRPDERDHFHDACQKSDDQRIGNIHGPHAEENDKGHDDGKEQLPAQVGIQHEMDFLEDRLEMMMETVRKETDEDMHEIAAFLHHVECDEGYDDELDHRTCKREDRGQAELCDLQRILADILNDAGNEIFRFRRHQGELVLPLDLRDRLLYRCYHIGDAFHEGTEFSDERHDDVDNDHIYNADKDGKGDQDRDIIGHLRHPAADADMFMDEFRQRIQKDREHE